MIESPDRRRSLFSSRSPRYLGGAFAITVSLISLWVAFSANRTQERLLAASVWPALEYGTGNRSDTGADEITLVIGNKGTGPARLRGVRVLYDGKFIPNSVALLNVCSITAIGSSAIPKAPALCCHALTNPLKTRLAVGTPCFSIRAMSWASHDVQPPQSPRMPITTSHSSAIALAPCSLSVLGIDPA